ncbi:cyclophilin-like domain-containing protein [Kalaharituber pfeilii]|nr:cyclophilin-like domain-containing protein [Kalaharituber pfeilii]
MSVTFHTDLGDLKIEVFCEAVPKTAENFLALCASGYYDNVLIHRNIKGFIFQLGDPTGTGKGGNSIWGEPFEDEIRPALRHNSRGVVSMANSGPGTNGSQFFVTYGSHPHLDGRNTIFGRVIAGEETLDTLEAVEVDMKGRPRKEIRVKGVTVHANPIADASEE